MAAITGTIATLVLDKKFGFVRNDGGVEYFFHKTDLMGGAVFEDLREGQMLTFEEAGATTKGPRAARVRVL